MLEPRCVRCGTEGQITPADEALRDLIDEHLPGSELDTLCTNLWLLKLIVFMCENATQPDAGLCPTCRSHKL